MYIKPLKIGNVVLENNIILAPMAGITDKAFRKICKEYGAGLVCTEMASSRAIFYNDKKTEKLLDITGEKRPISVQIFGSDIESIKAGVKYVNSFADIVDINMGCPAPKVVKNGDGSRLLQDLNLIEQIVDVAVKTSKIPVTVKIRKGWNSHSIVAVEVAKIIEKAGVSAITIHGRTREEFFSGKCDLDIIKKVKNSVSIPVIGNGDVTKPEDAYNMFEYTGVDGIMIGRGALGNPWIFEQILQYLDIGEKGKEITPKERLEVILKHINMEVEEKGEIVAIKEMRKHISWYTKSLKDSTKLRTKINTLETKDDVAGCLTEYFKRQV